jgi:probable rRNA maturation factor
MSDMAEGDRRLDVSVSDERGRAVTAPGLAAWLRRVAPARARGAVSVALISDVRARALNRSYLRKDYATDVLSFPANDSAKRGRTPFSTDPERKRGTTPLRPANPESPIPNPFLGDIVIARGVARRQARAAGHAERIELRILALHGLLHLLGYDHEQDNGGMLRLERRLRRKGGLREGLIERARRPEPSRGTTGSGRAVSYPSTASGRSRIARGEPVEPRARR